MGGKRHMNENSQKDDLQVITTRVPKKIIDYIEKIAKEEHLDKASLYRKFLYEAIEDDKIRRSIEKIKHNEITLLTAAEDAEIPLSVLIDELIHDNARWVSESKNIVMAKRSC
jgi:hypothetical protein